ncbi:MAG: protein-disulfide reductase DsbD domain-containing protein [Planctomycetota bacterium]
MVPQHEIFRSPLPVALDWHDIPTPAHYRDRWNGRELGETLRAWQVQDVGYEDDPQMPAGVVGRSWGYDDAPDSEFISSGVNTKGPRYAALGRHGPFFQWGFSAAPPRMTEAGRRAFVNAICYIHRFDRQAPLTRKTERHRGWALDRALGLKNIDRQYAETREWYAERQALHARAEQAQKAGRDLTEEEQGALQYPPGTAPPFEDYQKMLLRGIPDALVERLGVGAEAWPKYLAHYTEHLGYIRHGPSGYEVDDDARTLGIANHDPKLLHRAVAMLERGEDAERARDLLQRYTGLALGEAAAWRQWLDMVDGHLFFSDHGGYRFYVDDPALGAHAEFLTQPGTEPTASAPVAVDAFAVPATARPGTEVQLGVRLRMAYGWHTYAATEGDSPFVATQLEVELPDGAEARGDWLMPPPEPYPADPGAMIYRNDVVFVRTIRLPLDIDQAQGLELTANVSFQACDASVCLRPEEVRAAAMVQVRPPSR